MFRLVTESVLHGGRFVRNHPELILTLILVVLIPIAFLVSGQQFLGAARSNQERLILDRLGLLHDVMGSYLEAVAFDPERVQSEIEHLRDLNPDIQRFIVARDEGREVRILASLDLRERDTFAEDPDAFRHSFVDADETFVTPYAVDGVRLWQSLNVIQADNAPPHYILVETSLLHVDSLFAERIRVAHYWLVGLLIIIFFILIRHVRLIDYSYLYRETKKAIEMKDLFTNMIAHELRAPLTAMRGYASMIRERTGVDSVTKSNAEEIESAASRLVTIVSDLLDIARIQSGKMHIERSEIHVSGIMRSVVEALHPSAEEKGISLAIDDPKGTTLLHGDEKRLFQVLTNVLSNAIKYTKEGTVTLALTESQDRIEIRVKDTGMGISAQDQQKMFAPFFRVEGKDTASITGTGLGLWVTKQLVELMGGSIGVESIKGIGTHVVLTFPK